MKSKKLRSDAKLRGRIGRGYRFGPGSPAAREAHAPPKVIVLVVVGRQELRELNVLVLGDA